MAQIPVQMDVRVKEKLEKMKGKKGWSEFFWEDILKEKQPWSDMIYPNLKKKKDLKQKRFEPCSKK